MLSVELDDLKYCRQILESPNEKELSDIRSAFDYAFVVCYEPFSHPDFTTIEKKSAIISLKGDIDNVLASFHSTCRNEVRRTFRTPELSFRKITNNWKEAYEFHKQCEIERKWMPVPETEFRNSLVWSAWYQGKMLAGMSCYTSDEVLRVGRIFSRRRSGEFKNIPSVLFSAASRRVVYELCDYGIRTGKNFIDLGGIDPDDPMKKGITKFKMYFGSKVKPVYLGRWENERFQRSKNDLIKRGLDIT